MLKLLLKLYKSKKTTAQDRAVILNALLEKINGFPITDILTYQDNRIKINGKQLDIEQSIAFKEAAIALDKNWFYKVIKEQIAYEAINIGVHKGQTNDQLVFSKAVLWIQEREKELTGRFSELFDKENTY